MTVDVAEAGMVGKLANIAVSVESFNESMAELVLP